MRGIAVLLSAWLPAAAFAGPVVEGVPVDGVAAPAAPAVAGAVPGQARAGNGISASSNLKNSRFLQWFKKRTADSPLPSPLPTGEGGQGPGEGNAVPADAALAPNEALADVSSPKVSASDAKNIVDEDWQRRVEGKNGGLKVWVTASEAVPFIKTGGLADVTDALSREIASRGHRVTLVLPKYKDLKLAGLPEPVRVPGVMKVQMGAREEAAALWRTKSGNVDVVLIDNHYFRREGVYGSTYGSHEDNDNRFHFFSKAALEAARYLGERPDVVHAHDWPSALVPALLAGEHGADAYFRHTASVLTVHNMAYQGDFHETVLERIGAPADALAHQGRTNYLRAGLILADKITTVSRNYAQEVKQPGSFGAGMQDVLNQRAADFNGIVNGIDMGVWDPAADPELFRSYDARTWQSGKLANKLALQKMAGLPQDPDAPIFGIAARLDPQKGLDLVAKLAPLLAREGAQLVVVGNGSKEVEGLFHELMKQFPTTVFARTVFDEKFARKLYAASDFYLMPSRFEPCGLSQLIAMRYGSVPIVSPVGGLVDTVDDKTGFLMRENTPAALEAAVLEALASWRSPEHLDKVKTGMARDSSWSVPATQYLEIYRRAIAKKRSSVASERRERAYFPEIGIALGDGTLIEGSKAVGGTQNDFRIDYQDKDLFEKLVVPARAIGASDGDVWTKIRDIQALVNRVMPRDGMKKEQYARFNEDTLPHRNVSLGDYIRARSGVCRENALLTALALREAGLQARFAYFGVFSERGEYDEDHGTALVDVNDTTYIVDSFRPYGRYYNGHRLADLVQPPADGKYPGASPLAAANEKDPGRWRFELHPFPSVTRL